MAESRGKKFERQFKLDWSKYVPDSFCYRLYDVMSGFQGVAGVSDFINFKKPNIYLIDCKSLEGNTLNFASFSQYDKMIEYKDVTGLYAGTIAWFIDHDKVIWIPITTWEKIKLEGKKSFNIKMLGNPEYECLEIPSVKKRVFMESNYSALIDYYEGK